MYHTDTKMAYCCHLCIAFVLDCCTMSFPPEQCEQCPACCFRVYNEAYWCNLQINSHGSYKQNELSLGDTRKWNSQALEK